MLRPLQRQAQDHMSPEALQASSSAEQLRPDGGRLLHDWAAGSLTPVGSRERDLLADLIVFPGKKSARESATVQISCQELAADCVLECVRFMRRMVLSAERRRRVSMWDGASAAVVRVLLVPALRPPSAGPRSFLIRAHSPETRCDTPCVRIHGVKYDDFFESDYSSIAFDKTMEVVK